MGDGPVILPPQLVAMRAWIIGVLVLALLGVIATQTVRLAGARADLAAARADMAAERERHAVASANAVQAARDEEQRRVKAQEGVIHAQAEEVAIARAAAAAASDAAERLRDRFAAAARRSPAACYPAAAIASAPATTAIDMLADVQRRLDEAAGTLGQYADAARIAGFACERSYDALMPPGESGR